MLNRHLAALQAAGQIESFFRDLNDLSSQLAQVPQWRPATVLAKQAAEARRIITGMQERLDRRLVVTLIGPSGAGKSTLLNALAGVDDLSPTGVRRPTTRQLVVLSNDRDAAQQIFGTGQPADTLIIRGSDAAETLDHLILVDTPDTDSTLRDEHLESLMRAVSFSDVLICVFDAQNPKRRDHADIMAPLVRRFSGASLVAVVNKCDRLDQQEITESVGPDFMAYLQQAWDTKPEALFFTSARSHLQHPDWDAAAVPRHTLDHFNELKKLVFTTFNRPGFGPDRRVANARQICNYLVSQVEHAVTNGREHLQQALTQMAQAEKQAMIEALSVLRTDQRRQLLGVNVRLYQALAQRWIGPVGWMVAIWSRLIVFGSGLTALVRFGNPITQIWGLISSWKRFKESRSALEALNDQTHIDTALAGFRKVLLTHWPDIAETLIRGDFDTQVRRLAVDETTGAAKELENLWAEGLDVEIDRSAKHLSHFFLQLLFNLPGLCLLGYVGWLTAESFFKAQYLTSDFFLHALLTIAILLLLCFFVLQLLVWLTVRGDRIQRRAFKKLEKAAGEGTFSVLHGLIDQINAVLGLQHPDNKNDRPE